MAHKLFRQPVLIPFLSLSPKFVAIVRAYSCRQLSVLFVQAKQAISMSRLKFIIKVLVSLDPANKWAVQHTRRSGATRV
jgi:hypothetical protein